MLKTTYYFLKIEQKAVYDYLLLEDITPIRLIFKGYGQANPNATNNTDEGRSKNRRTEFVIVSK